MGCYKDIGVTRVYTFVLIRPICDGKACIKQNDNG